MNELVVTAYNNRVYRNARRRSYCYYDNGERWRRNKYTSDFEERT